MSTIYILPPRPILGKRFAEFLGLTFPNSRWRKEHWSDLAEAIGTAVQSHPDVYVIFREDLPDGDLDETLLTCCGADPGDEVISVNLGSRSSEMTTQRWQLAWPD